MPLRKKEEAKQKFDSFDKNFTLEEARTNVYILIDEIYEAKDQEIAELKELTQKKSCYDYKDYLYGVCVDPRGCYCIWQQGMQDRHTKIFKSIFE